MNETATTEPENDKLARPATIKNLLTFATPTILSMILMSFFGIIDGVFASRLISPLALSATGIVFPMLTFIMSIGFMLGVGGNALVAKQLGEGNTKYANKNFNLIVAVAFGASITLAVVGAIFVEPLLVFLGANESIFDMALAYITPFLLTLPFIAMGVIFNQFLMTEGKAHLSTIGTVVGGLVNVALNYLLIYVFQMGLTGAAIATSTNFAIPTLIGIGYFATNKKGSLRFGRFNWHTQTVLKAAGNGASEMVTMMSIAIVAVYMNNIAIDIEGPLGVASLTIAFTVLNILSGLFIGFSAGIMPIISYKFGQADDAGLHQLWKNALTVLVVLSVVNIGLANLLVSPLVRIYVPVADPVYAMTVTGLRLMTFGFVFMGVNMFSSMFFTALNNGLVSSILVFFRSLVFAMIAMSILPGLFGMTGLWLSIPVAEVPALLLTIYIFNKYKARYHYTPAHIRCKA